MKPENIKRKHVLFTILFIVLVIFILVQFTSLFNKKVSAAEYSGYIVGEWVENTNTDDESKVITKYLENGTFTTRYEKDNKVVRSFSGKWKIENGNLHKKGIDIHNNFYDKVTIINELNNQNMKVTEHFPPIELGSLLSYKKMDK